MSVSADELAGIVDLFGALTRAELSNALGELAFKQGDSVDHDAVGDVIDAAIADYVLVEYQPKSEGGDTNETAPLLVVGPTAFPSQPPNAEDLPHILDYERRAVDRSQAAEQLTDRLRREAALAVNNEDFDRIDDLLDRCYDIELWADIDTDGLRDALVAELPQD